MTRRRGSGRRGRGPYRKGRGTTSPRNRMTIVVLVVLVAAVAFGRSADLREGVAALLPFTATSPPEAASARTYEGPVTYIVDGDTFDIRADGEVVRIRVCGIDAPERGEPGFEKATDIVPIFNTAFWKAQHAIGCADRASC